MKRCQGIARGAALLALTCAVQPVAAEVRFGPGVRVAGHDFSPRRTGSVYIERVRRLRGPLGCRHLRDSAYRRGNGSVVRGPMEECNLVARRR